MNKFIYITGADGTGKTTQAHLLLERLRVQGIKARVVWLRFPFFFSLPLLAYARLCGCSWYEEESDYRLGYWDFRRSWLMRAVFPWVLLADAFLAALSRIYLPLLRGETIVCERFALDMLADLMVATQDESYHRSLPGRGFIRLIPRNAQLVVLDLDADTARNRRMDLSFDHRLEARLEAYQAIARDLKITKITVLSSALPIQAVQENILNEMGLAAQ
jgi:thymidylate kinase